MVSTCHDVNLASASAVTTPAAKAIVTRRPALTPSMSIPVRHRASRETREHHATQRSSAYVLPVPVPPTANVCPVGRDATSRKKVLSEPPGSASTDHESPSQRISTS
jgi:hypothetical protein